MQQQILIPISKDDKLVAQLHKDLLALQGARLLMSGASLFRAEGELFTQPADAAKEQRLFDEK